jgi:hypothetical protein
MSTSSADRFSTTALLGVLLSFACGGDDIEEGNGANETEPATTDTSDLSTTSSTTEAEGEASGETQGEAGDGTGGEDAGETQDPPPSACEGLQHDDCEATLGCAWLGTPEAGICAVEGGGGIELCDALDMQQCTVAPGCVWNEDDGSCEALGCESLAQGQCTLAPECNWDPVEMRCREA